MTNEPGQTYQFDAENRISSVNGGSVGAYVYDAGGRRVRKTVAAGITDYFYDLGGQVVAERQAGVWTKAYVYAGGQLVAQYSNSSTYFVHKDHLGSTRMLTTVSQAVSATFDYQPFGESIGSGSATTHKFTGKERDDESGLDDFGARYYSSAYGRFMSADPPFIDQHPGDPQSWNLFAYVRYNPLKFVDPTGNANIAAGCIASCQEMEDVGSGRAGGTVTESDDTAGYTDIQLEAQDFEAFLLTLMAQQQQLQRQAQPPAPKQDDPNNLVLVPITDDGTPGNQYRVVVYEVQQKGSKKPEENWYVTEHQTQRDVTSNGQGTSGGSKDEPNKFRDLIGSGNGSKIDTVQTFTISRNPGVDAKPQFTINVRVPGMNNADFGALGIYKDHNGVRIQGLFHWPGVFPPTQ